MQSPRSTVYRRHFLQLFSTQKRGEVFIISASNSGKNDQSYSRSDEKVLGLPMQLYDLLGRDQGCIAVVLLGLFNEGSAESLCHHGFYLQACCFISLVIKQPPDTLYANIQRSFSLWRIFLLKYLQSTIQENCRKFTLNAILRYKMWQAKNYLAVREASALRIMAMVRKVLVFQGRPFFCPS